MELELQCAGCGCRLAIPAEAAGREVECPQCGRRQVAKERPAPKPADFADPTAKAVPIPGQPSPVEATLDEPAEPAPPPPAEWFLKVPEGLIYGPINVLQLNDWVAQGRVSPDCQLRSETNPEWLGAERYYPVLCLPPPRRPGFMPLAHPAKSPAKGAAARPKPAPDPTVEHLRSFDRIVPRVAPHRGLSILLLSILGWITCPIAGVVAWNMATYDLNEMREKRMDPAGFAQTQAGYYLAFSNLVVFTVTLVVGLLIGAATWLLYGSR
jgi:DNA-directed RNA polymerase subunit RPC12/RpoP